MATPRLVQQQVLAWIASEVAEHRVPDEPALAAQFPLLDGRTLRAVLADLADASKVTVDWKATPVTVSLGRRKPAPLPTARPDRVITARDFGDPHDVARMRRILGKTPRKPESPEAAIERATAAQRPAPALPAVEPAPATVTPIAVRPLITAAMTAAAIRDGMPVIDFAAMLLARGFTSYEADAAMERAA